MNQIRFAFFGITNDNLWLYKIPQHNRRIARRSFLTSKNPPTN